jgi:hypothetical protein
VKPALFTPDAEADVEEAFEWYEAQRPGLGAAFRGAVVPSALLWRPSRISLRPTRSFTAIRTGSCCPGFLMDMRRANDEMKLTKPALPRMRGLLSLSRCSTARGERPL